ncbi:tetratricopeptide repeat protein [Desulfonatronum thioautotrophicum]|uniref:tetratricopeptide repeat protein n=1 Tax=Desulfonatronum thioautotrophicum TaxID=617001 RepID=UPI000A666416|nr:tetratricopeptide repeat protein [Desulfonatronum thioautotrophicum]
MRVWGLTLGLALGVLLLCWTKGAVALEAEFRQYSLSEQVLLSLDPAGSAEFMPPSVYRTDARVLQIDLTGQQAALNDVLLPNLAGSQLLTAIFREPGGLVLRTSTEDFGFVSRFDTETGRLVIDFFPDPLGSRWRELQPQPRAATQATVSLPQPQPGGVSPPPSAPNMVGQTPPSDAVQQEARQPVQAVPAYRGNAAAGVAEPLDSQDQVPSRPALEPLRERTPESISQTAAEAALTQHEERTQLVARESESSLRSVVRSPIRRIGPEEVEEVPPVHSAESDRLMDAEPEPPLPSAQEPISRSIEPSPLDGRNALATESDSGAQQTSPSWTRGPILRQPVSGTEEEEPGVPGEVAREAPGVAGDVSGEATGDAVGEDLADAVRELPSTDAQEVFQESQADSQNEVVAEQLPLVLEQPDLLAREPDADSDESSASEPATAPMPGTAAEPEEDPDARYSRLVAAARAAMMNGEFDVAVESLEVLANTADLSDSLREEILYDLGDALFGLHQDDLAGNFSTVAQAYERAMHFNPASRRTALALRNLGVLHLRVNNLPEARAYFNVLRRDFPHDPLVPTTEYYLGQYFLDRGDFNLAADHFQTVVQNHPEHSIVQQSSIGLARALNALGFDEQASQIMDFLERRWPRYYIDEPELLELAGIIALRVNALEAAKQRLLTFYNLVPDTPEAHMLLARIGDIYLLTGKPEAARRVFEKTAQMFPEQEGGLIAKMRLVEGGIHDEPSLEDMFTTRRAAEVYSEIISRHPDSPLAAVATIKLAIWQVWNKRLEDSLMVLSEFLQTHPGHSLVPKALEVGTEAFTQLVARNAADGRYPEILEQWRNNPFLHDLLDDMSPTTQLGLAMAYWREGDLEQAIALARPYLREDTPKSLQVAALDLILGIFLEQQEWERIVDLAPLREDLPTPQRRELTYSVALALENLERPEEARPLWSGLAGDLELSEAQRGYALYFLARSAMQEEQFERVYRYAQEALSLLLLEQEDPGKIRDAITWLTQVTERTGRLQEALAWALELDQLIDRSDPDWSMSRYRLAQLHQRLHNHAEWQAVLEDLKSEDPRGLYGRLAASALQGRDLEDSAGRFLQ